MKTIILLYLTLVTTSSYSQKYSTYYLNADVKADVDVNVTGQVYQYKTIRTIDYGALQLANAQREKNRLEEIRFADDKQKRVALEIAEDPLKAYDYGNAISYELKKIDKTIRKKIEDLTGFNNFSLSFVAPNASLFTMIDDGTSKFQNVSKEGITTEIMIIVPFYNKSKKKIDLEAEEDSILATKVIGKEMEVLDDYDKKRKIYYHKKELNRATVFGIKGYKSTSVWEDKFEYGITDNYSSINQNVGNGSSMFATVRYYGDKDNITFEQLEGRRFYFTRLMEKIISTAVISNEKINK